VIKAARAAFTVSRLDAAPDETELEEATADLQATQWLQIGFIEPYQTMISLNYFIRTKISSN